MINIFFIITVNANQSNGCGNETEELAKCQKIKFFTSSEDFKSERMVEICDDYSHAMRCIQNYTRTCMDTKRYQKFHRIMKGTTSTMNELCRVKGVYYQKFIKHSECIKSINMEHCSFKFHESSQVSNKNQNVSLSRVCCSMHQYMECTESASLDACGTDTANFVREFYIKMLTPLINPHCNNFESKLECLAYTSSSHNIYFSQILLLFTFILSIFKLFNLIY